MVYISKCMELAGLYLPQYNINTPSVLEYIDTLRFLLSQTILNLTMNREKIIIIDNVKMTLADSS